MRFLEGGRGSPGHGDVSAPPVASHLKRELSLIPLIAVIFFLWVWYRQVSRHDELIRQGKKDEVVDEMIR